MNARDLTKDLFIINLLKQMFVFTILVACLTLSIMLMQEFMGKLKL